MSKSLYHCEACNLDVKHKRAHVKSLGHIYRVNNPLPQILKTDVINNISSASSISSINSVSNVDNIKSVGNISSVSGISNAYSVYSTNNLNYIEEVKDDEVKNKEVEDEEVRDKIEKVKEIDEVKDKIEMVKEVDDVKVAEEVKEYKYNCDKCNYHNDYKSNWEKHINTNKHKFTEAECKELQKIQGSKTTEIGDATEIYIEDIFKESKDIEYLERIGQKSGHRFDIIMKFKDDNNNIRGIQAKTLYLRDDTYYLTVKKKNRYEDDTLIVGVDELRTKFVLFFYDIAKDITGVGFTFGKINKNNRDSKNNIYAKYEYTDFEKFKNNLYELSKKSTILDADQSKYITHGNLSEYKMLQLLKIECEKVNKNFSYLLTNNDQIDCEIDAFRVQCKSSLYKKTPHKYSFHLSKKSNQIPIPYSIDDNIHFFIFHISGTNYFYTIPTYELIARGFITTPEQQGQIQISMSTLDIDVDDITPFELGYVNRFDLISNHKIKMNIRFEIGLDKQLVNNKIPFTTIHNNNDYIIDTINGKSIKYSRSNYSQRKNGLYTFAISKITNNEKISFENMGFQFLICEIKNNHNMYFIIPRDVLIKQKLISAITISMASDDYKGDHWSRKYLNRFDLLK